MMVLKHIRRCAHEYFAKAVAERTGNNIAMANYFHGMAIGYMRSAECQNDFHPHVESITIESLVDLDRTDQLFRVRVPQVQGAE